MSFFVTDLNRLYEQTFYSKPYVINNTNESGPTLLSTKGYVLRESYLNKEIWLPTTFAGLKKERFTNDGTERFVGISELYLPYTTVQISSKKNMVETELNNRIGSVKELFNVGDFQIAIKGFLIDDKNRLWPEEQIEFLHNLYMVKEEVELRNALTDIFLMDIGCAVVIKSISFPEVTGGRTHVRPFAMELVSDNIFNLIVEG